jgi:outer membrane protein TolC
LLQGEKMKSHARVVAVAFCFLAFTKSLPAQDQGKPLPFRTAIELALRNSATSSLSRADLERARATVTEARDQFIPSMTVGSALGYSNGFPLSLEGSAPSLFNVNIQGLLLNAAQHDYVKAAQSDAQATAAQNADRRNDVILETALSYMQLDLLDSSIAVQKEQQEAAAKFQDIASQRVQAGLDSSVELKRAKLVVARTQLDIARTRAAADALRLRLSQLTGLPAPSIQTSTETIPQLPSVSQDDDLPSQALGRNPAVTMAEALASAKEFRAQAERKQLYPTVDLAGQYAVLAKYNNYAEFFKTFERNNLSIGVVIRFPFFNSTLRSAANVARFDAVKARQEARTVKEQVSEETLKLQRSVQQFVAARDVAQLEHELAESDIDTTHAKIETGGASLKDEENARVAEHERYTAYLSSSFDLDKAQVQLLRQTGELENWALGPKR